MSELAKLGVEREADLCIVRIDGEIDASNSGELRERLLDEARGAARGLVVDLSGTGYLDSAGIALLMEVGSRLGGRDRFGIAVAPGSFADEVLRTAGLANLFAIEPSAAAAASSLGA